MIISPDKYAGRLVEILQKKTLLLQDILVLTEAQASQINENGIDDLQRLISQKQSKIDEINKLDEEFNVYFQRLKSTMKINSLSELDASGFDGAKQLKAATLEIMQLITKISEVEKSNKEKGEKLLRYFADEIKKVNQGKKMNSAYVPGPIKIPSYFIDKKE